ncbi:unnamed protein product [Effrenium voratum]|uniref:DoxX family protein n=1 Tax=Effrenium voratum TaxID=2562239 RepID=A0AA36JDL1_9DINO|nr:unnamed protein product [Effrenium voratum]
MGDPLEWALRVVLAMALGIHSILDVTDPCHGVKSELLQVGESLPGWFLPAIGLLRAAAALELFSDNPNAVLGALAYASASWCGAICFHVRCKHHPAAPVPAGLFVLLVAILTAMRVNLWFALAGTAACAALGVLLGFVFVTPPPPSPRDAALLDG